MILREAQHGLGSDDRFGLIVCSYSAAVKVRNYGAVPIALLMIVISAHFLTGMPLEPSVYSFISAPSLIWIVLWLRHDAKNPQRILVLGERLTLVFWFRDDIQAELKEVELSAYDFFGGHVLSVFGKCFVVHSSISNFGLLADLCSVSPAKTPSAGFRVTKPTNENPGSSK